MFKISNINLINLNIIIKIFLISILFFLAKWGTSFYFLNEDKIVKILFESISDGSFYYPLIKFLSNINFTDSLNPLTNEIQSVAIPFGSIIIHTFFYKIFGLNGFIIADLFGIFLFLLIFYRIFLFFNSENNSVFYSLLLFGLPILLNVYLNDYNNIPFLQFKNFFTLRVHRPFPSSLYFFSFILLILFMNQNKIFQKKNFIIAGILMGLSFSSFYYFFITEAIIFSLFIILSYKGKTINFLFNNYISILLLVFIFIFVSLPFIINMFLVEKDVMTSAGVFQLTNDKRFLLANHYFAKLFNLKFLIINFIIFCLIFSINKIKIQHFNIINIFFIIYISCLLAPFLLIFLSPKIGHMYHFNNNIVIYGILLLFVSAIIIFHSKFQIRLNYIYLLVFLLITSIVQGLNDRNNTNTVRDEFNKISNIINSKIQKKKNNSLLTFDQRFMIWGILNDKIDFLNLTMVGSTGKNYDLIENDLIKSFKFFNLDSSDFLIFLENKKRGYRYINGHVAIFFRHRYTANSMFTFEGSQNFDPKIKDFILNSSPLYAQQLAIPLEEFLRLKNKFDSLTAENFLLPKIIVLNNNLSFFKKIELNPDDYCIAFSGKKYTLFFSNDGNIKCNDYNSLSSN